MKQKNDTWIDAAKIMAMLILIITMVVLAVVVYNYMNFMKLNPCEACREIGYVCIKTLSIKAGG